MIRVYSSPSCHNCHDLKDYLKGKKEKFEEVDVTKDAQALELIVDVTGMRKVPVTYIHGAWIVGFDKEKIDEALKDQNF